MANSVFCKTFNTFSLLLRQHAVKKLQNNKPIFNTTSIVSANVCFPVRHSSFRSSEPVGNINDHPHVDIVKNPPEWQYVERILSKPLVPEPTPKTEYPSGWKPSKHTKIDNKTLSYFIPRTKNHMIPVYLKITYRGQRHVTQLKHIHGDIWKLENELHQMIEKNIGKKIVTRINEMSGQIWFKGDYVTMIGNYLMNKGY